MFNKKYKLETKKHFQDLDMRYKMLQNAVTQLQGRWDDLQKGVEDTQKEVELFEEKTVKIHEEQRDDYRAHAKYTEAHNKRHAGQVERFLAAIEKKIDG